MKRLSRVITAVWLAASMPVSALVITPNPILFVAQVPVPADFTITTTVFGNRHRDLRSVGHCDDVCVGALLPYINIANGTSF